MFAGLVARLARGAFRAGGKRAHASAGGRASSCPERIFRYAVVFYHADSICPLWLFGDEYPLELPVRPEACPQKREQSRCRKSPRLRGGSGRGRGKGETTGPHGRRALPENLLQRLRRLLPESGRTLPGSRPCRIPKSLALTTCRLLEDRSWWPHTLLQRVMYLSASGFARRARFRSELLVFITLIVYYNIDNALWISVNPGEQSCFCRWPEGALITSIKTFC